MNRRQLRIALSWNAVPPHEHPTFDDALHCRETQMAIAVERDLGPKRGATIKLETRADVAEFYSALVAGNVKGVAQEVVIKLLSLLSE